MEKYIYMYKCNKEQQQQKIPSERPLPDGRLL